MKILNVSLFGFLLLLAVLIVPQEAFAKGKVTIEYLEQHIGSMQGDKKEKKKAELLYQLGEKYFAKGDFAKAESNIRKSLELEDSLYEKGKSKVNPDSNFIPRVHTRVALASVLIKQNKLSSAVSEYVTAIKILEELNKPQEAAKLACHLGNIEIKLGHYDKASSYFDKANNFAQSANAKESQVTALIGLATIDRIKNNNVSAIEKLKKAKEVGGLELDGIAYGRLLNELGRTYSDMDLYTEALENYSNAAKEFESYGELVFKANVLTSIGEVYLAQRKGDSALKVLREAYEILKAEKTPRQLAKTLIPYGSALAESGQPDKALKCHKLAYKIAKKLNDNNTRMLALLEEGYDNFVKGDLEASLKCSLRADKFISSYKGKVSDKLKAQVLRDCGMGYRALGQIKAAIKYYKDAAGCFKGSGKLIDQAGMLESIAVAYLDEGNTEQFQIYHDLAKSVFEGTSKAQENSTKLLRAKGAFNYNFGQFKVYQGKYADAITLYEKSLQEYRKSNDKLGHCHALRGLGIAYLMLGQVGKSKDCYEEASVIASRIGNIESQWDCATGLGKAYIKLGEHGKAEEQLRKAVQLANKERKQYSRDSFKTLQLNLREDCFLELVELLVKQGKSKQALVVAESGRARAFLDMLEGRKASSLAGKKVARVSSNLLDDGLNNIEKSSTVKIAMVSPTAGLSGFRSVNVKPKSAFLVSPSAISPVAAKAPTLDELKLLATNSNSYIVEYITTPNKTIVWLMGPDGELLATESIDYDLDKLKDLIREAYTSIITTPDGMDEMHKLNEKREKALKQLYQLLIKPIEAKLPKDPETVVTVVPYGALYLVPYAALMSSDSKFLVEKHTLAYLPSIAVLRATSKLHNSAKGEENSLLAFGNPITEANKFLGALPYAKQEVEKIATLFDSANTKIELGGQATKSKFRALAPSYSYLHLATHGLINPDSPMDSSVVLAPEKGDDGLLTVKEILELPHLKAKLIVLSACQTGKGKVTGDGVIGLSRAFIIAGTPSIMVSQWNVDDVMTQYQMSLLYKELLSGKQKAHSLRTAQLKTISFMEKGLSSSFSDDTEEGASRIRANPRYWAAFQIIGEYR